MCPHFVDIKKGEHMVVYWLVTMVIMGVLSWIAGKQEKPTKWLALVVLVYGIYLCILRIWL